MAGVPRQANHQIQSKVHQSPLTYSMQMNYGRTLKDHAAVITYLDRYVGQLMDFKIEDLDNNTLVVFASDNGAHLEGGHDYSFSTQRVA